MCCPNAYRIGQDPTIFCRVVNLRYQFLLVPAAIVASAPALAGAYYLNIEQAQNLLFPGATFTPEFRTLTEQEMQTIVDNSHVSFHEMQIHVWRVSTGGWFFLDHVTGRDDEVVYAVALNAKGGVTGVEVLACLPEYSQIRRQDWLAQFYGRHAGEIQLNNDIKSSPAPRSRHGISPKVSSGFWPPTR
jgi:hypothetical protein